MAEGYSIPFSVPILLACFLGKDVMVGRNRGNKSTRIPVIVNAI